MLPHGYLDISCVILNSYNCMLCTCAGNMPADVYNAADNDIDVDLMNELTRSDVVLSPTLLNLDSLPESCANNEPTLDADSVVLDLDELEEFMDLTEFLVSSMVCN